MKRSFGLSVSVLMLIAALSACGGGGGGNDGNPQLATLSTVTAAYPNNGANWNDYVKNDGASITAATDTACAGTETGGYSACLHGGEMRALAVTGKSSCAGLTASDSLGAFDWTCDAGTDPVRMVSTRLKDGKNLSDLLDFTTPGWRTISVTVNSGGSAYGITPATAWWTNPLVVDNDGMTSGEMDVAGTIYLVTTNAIGTYALGADRIALVIKPGAILAGPGTDANVVSHDAGATKHLWIEGAINALNDSAGVYWNGIVFSVLRNVRTDNANSGGWANGIYLDGSSSNSLIDISASNNITNGVRLANSASNNALSGVAAANNVGGGIAITVSSNNNSLTNISTANNAGTGIGLVSSSNNVLTNVSVMNSGAYGVVMTMASNNVLTNVTLANNGNSGIYINNALSVNNCFSNVTAMNNNGAGVREDSAGSSILSNISAARNGAGVFLANSSNNKFTGLLKVGSDGCGVSGGTDPGLVTGSCANQGASDATLSIGVTLDSSFVGPLFAGDSVNVSDTNGAADYGSITDWLNFENDFRGWGRNGTMGDPTSYGQCSSGMCRIWDWSLASGDSVNRNVLTQPTGNDTLTHRWYTAATPASQADCDTAVPGSIFNTDHCENTFLKNAIETADDGIGNDNFLCESNETCLFTPNIGSYQGHGNLISAGAFTNGTITGVTLMTYETNGR